MTAALSNTPTRQSAPRAGRSGPIQDRDVVSGLERGLSVIEVFSEERARLSLSDVARLAGITRAAARRYLLTLTKMGYAAFDGKLFSLTPKVLRLGSCCLSSMRLPRQAQPLVERVAEAFGGGLSSVAVLDGDAVMVVARAPVEGVSPLHRGVGRRLPAHCTALGRVLMAHQAPSWIEDFFDGGVREAFTATTKITPADLRGALDLVRFRGHALVEEEFEPGMRAVAMPVFDDGGRITCAIDLAAPSEEGDRGAFLAAALPLLRAASRDLRLETAPARLARTLAHAS